MNPLNSTIRRIFEITVLFLVFAGAWLFSDGFVREPDCMAESSRCEAWLEIENKSDASLITGFCRSEAYLESNYKLSAFKDGPSGTSRSVQTGKLRLEPGEKHRLSQVKMGLGEGDALTIILEILSDGERIAVATETLPR